MKPESARYTYIIKNPIVSSEAARLCSHIADEGFVHKEAYLFSPQSTVSLIKNPPVTFDLSQSKDSVKILMENRPLRRNEQLIRIQNKNPIKMLTIEAIEIEIALFSFSWEAQGSQARLFILCFKYPS